MSIARKTRILAAAKELNVGKDTAVAFLKGKGFEVDETKPDPKITAEMYDAMQKEYADDKAVKKESDSIELPKGGGASKTAEEITEEKEESKKVAKTAAKKTAKKEEKPVEKPVEEPAEKKDEVKIEAKTETKPETSKPEMVEEVKEPKVEKETPTKPVPEKEEAPKVEKVLPEEKKETPKPKEVVEEKPKVEEPKKEAEKVVAETPKPKAVEPKKEAPKEEVKEVAKTPEVSETKEEETTSHIGMKAPTLDGPKVVATIDLNQFKKQPTKKATAKDAPRDRRDAKVVKGPVAKKDTSKPEQQTKKPIDKPTTPKKETTVATPEAKKDNTPATPEEPKVEHIAMSAPRLEGPRVVGKIELPVDTKSSDRKDRKKRKRIPVDKKGTPTANRPAGAGKRRAGGGPGGAPGAGTGPKGRRTGPGRGGPKKARVALPPQEIDAKAIQDKIRETQAKLAGGMAGGRGRAKSRGTRRTRRDEQDRRSQEEVVSENKLIQVTEFISVSEFANLLDVSFTDVISKCMSLGIMVSINQRLDAEVIELVANEFGSEVEFLDLEDTETEEEILEENPEDLVARAPIVTIMGHVDHGKTSLLDYVRNATVVAGEAGGITQHIGAYKVTTKDGKQLAFLDTPGHEAFTAMRARGAKVADVAIIVIAADDAIMPQTKEAISHAQAASLPMVFAINKIDKESANPEKIKEQLANMNILVEDWGGAYQSQEISAKKGINIDELLEKVLLETEILELTANPDREATGSVIEAELDKGRGYVSTVLVQSGTLKAGDLIVTGQFYGKVRAMMNERGQRVQEAGPSTPVQVLGLNGAPQAGERFKVYRDESEAKNIATHRAQILREQGLRSRKHITLDEIGRRLALGTFKELNIIIKADYDGSAEALSDSLQKLSTEEIHVNVVLKSVGQITESDVNLASASDAIIIGFQVRPSVQAAQLADSENIEIRHYSIIYDAIEELKSAMEGMLEPKFEKKVVGHIEVREIYKISSIGTIAGCYVTDGKFSRNTHVNVIRDGIVVHTGDLASLKRFKDDVREVVAGYECGLSLKGFNDLKEGDVLEGFEEVEVKREL